jgi:AraC-like DNA-binding protein
MVSDRQRIERAKELLKQADVSLVNVALTVGSQTQAHFTTAFKRFAGDTPYQWRSAYFTQPVAERGDETRANCSLSPLLRVIAPAWSTSAFSNRIAEQ